jgi:phosphoglycolate phosphatase
MAEGKRAPCTRYKLVLFDFDGTLADSAEWFLQRINELAGEFKFRRIEEADYERMRNYSTEQIIEHMAMPRWRLPILLRRMRKAAAEDSGVIKLFPGAMRMLKELRAAGICVGIVSSNDEANIRLVLAAEGKEISFYECGASLFGKASKLKRVLRRSGFQPSETIYIGDELRDAVASRKAEIAFGAVAWGYTSIETLRREKPEMEFKEISEIVRKLL